MMTKSLDRVDTVADRSTLNIVKKIDQRVKVATIQILLQRKEVPDQRQVSTVVTEEVDLEVEVILLRNIRVTGEETVIGETGQEVQVRPEKRRSMTISREVMVFNYLRAILTKARLVEVIQVQTWVSMVTSKRKLKRKKD